MGALGVSWVRVSPPDLLECRPCGPCLLGSSLGLDPCGHSVTEGVGPGGGRPLSQALAEDLDTKGKEVWGNRALGRGRGENASSFGLCQ